MAPLSLAPEREPVRLGQTLSYSDLRDEVARAVRIDGRPHKELAKLVDVKPGSFSNALYNEGARYAKLQRSILKALRPEYDFEDVGGFKVVRPATGEGEAS